jgi:hypothetical protein
MKAPMLYPNKAYGKFNHGSISCANDAISGAMSDAAGSSASASRPGRQGTHTSTSAGR